MAIDQRSQEVLGKWPFSRSNFGEMLDALREDGARVVSFDVTFDKPDQTVAPIRALWAQIERDKKGGKPPDPKLAPLVASLAALSGMLAAGVVASSAQQASLNALAGSMTPPPSV